MSFELRDDVPYAKSLRSMSATLSPRLAASRATAAPVIPPPITSRSNCSFLKRTSACSRERNEKPTLALGSGACLRDSELSELFEGHGAWRLGHEIVALGGFRERHDVANRADTAEKSGE